MEPGESKSLFAVGNLKAYPDSEKNNVLILNLDSMNKYNLVKEKRGTLDKALIKKFTVQINRVKSPLDTIDVTEELPNTESSIRNSH